VERLSRRVWLPRTDRVALQAQAAREPAARDIFALLDFRLEHRTAYGRNGPLYLAAGLVLRSASTCLLIVLSWVWYISDETKLQFGQEGVDAHRVDDAKRAVKTIKDPP
jgi:hypothetical protein